MKNMNPAQILLLTVILVCVAVFVTVAEVPAFPALVEKMACCPMVCCDETTKI